MTTDDFDSMAKENHPSALSFDGDDQELFPLSKFSSKIAFQAKSNKGSERVFFSSEIQATDSTARGCTANKSPPHQAKVQPNLVKQRHNNTALNTCSATLTR